MNRYGTYLGPGKKKTKTKTKTKNVIFYGKNRGGIFSQKIIIFSISWPTTPLRSSSQGASDNILVHSVVQLVFFFKFAFYPISLG